MNQIKRNDLLALLNLVRPALAVQSFVPAWTHILLLDGFATTYNDTTMMSVKVPVDKEVSLCLPGELFVKALSSFNAESVLLQELEEGHMLVSSGKSKLKVPTLPAEDFKMPKALGKKPWTIELSDSILLGIAACRFSVGTDPTHPAQMGVTLSEESGQAVLYSTDNITISRYQTDTDIELPASTPIILPSFFCDQLLVLGKAYPALDIFLDIYPGAVVARFGSGAAEATLLTKMLVDLEPLDFDEIVSAYLKVDEVGTVGGFGEMPEQLTAAFTRALLVLSNETDKSTKVTVTSDSNVSVLSKSATGESSDDVDWHSKVKVRPFHVDPSLVVRASKQCRSMAFYDRVLLMATPDAKFIHLIAHCIA